MPPSPKQSYSKVTFHTPANLADEAAGMLVASGALGCSLAGMAKPHARAPKTVALEAWFDRITPRELSRLQIMLAGAGMLAPDSRIEAPRRIVDPGWSTMWMKRFGPFRVGRRFLIAPPWHRESQPSRVTIVIEPAQAFGTGHHPTTAGALRALENIAASRKPNSVLDAGTGSGVLAIAMALTGIRDIVAIDIDPIAIENAVVNARLNNVEKSIRFSSIPVTSIRRRFDLIVANILSHTLIELAPHLKRILAPNGRLVLGGFLADETGALLTHYRPLRCVSRKTHRGWTTLVMAKPQ
ncbi:MAG: 50S ribosomal protein L11 methyltransferase [Candidatus Binatus sp.]|uniref:50S ribosomal protein L11 methyltransferase n=1 Tax=Candidatus Binatus sp. TaxID=2811406 RepID=UPI00271FA416|nr:50S ribosomal protein L11 methyltransferase [Candidatus Binatus sp.]MDO8432711.1 50S ribosomal protein L11 methyltransferase [Candidatus Binatus sp.]